jgi:hypothetical protein
MRWFPHALSQLGPSPAAQAATPATPDAALLPRGGSAAIPVTAPPPAAAPAGMVAALLRMYSGGAPADAIAAPGAPRDATATAAQKRCDCRLATPDVGQYLLHGTHAIVRETCPPTPSHAAAFLWTPLAGSGSRQAAARRLGT